MQVKIFAIPIMGGERILEEMNTFLRSRKVLQLEKQFVNNTQGTFWCFCINYLDDRSSTEKRKIDYKEVLDQESFQRFSKMRKIRKRVAQEEDIPAYIVFTDAELAGLAKIKEALTPAKMKSVKGIGKKKVEKYGHHFITESPDEKD